MSIRYINNAHPPSSLLFTQDILVNKKIRDIMVRRKTRWRGRRRRRRIRQKGGILPLAALLPALIAGGKALGLGALSGGAAFGVKKALGAATRKRRK